jgi:hypothetical protein
MYNTRTGDRAHGVAAPRPFFDGPLGSSDDDTLLVCMDTDYNELYVLINEVVAASGPVFKRLPGGGSMKLACLLFHCSVRLYDLSMADEMRLGELIDAVSPTMRAVHLREEDDRLNKREWWYNEGLLRGGSTKTLSQAHLDPKEMYTQRHADLKRRGFPVPHVHQEKWSTIKLDLAKYAPKDPSDETAEEKGTRENAEFDDPAEREGRAAAALWGKQKAEEAAAAKAATCTS